MSYMGERAMYGAGVIKRFGESHQAVWDGLSSSKGASIVERVDASSIQASSEVDPYLASEARFSLRASIAIILGISLFLWYWLFQLGYYLLSIFV
ncbi:MAG: hypothetical protein ACREVK_13305 [Gammaproteobacteria bacterium]